MAKTMSSSANLNSLHKCTLKIDHNLDPEQTMKSPKLTFVAMNMMSNLAKFYADIFQAVKDLTLFRAGGGGGAHCAAPPPPPPPR